MDNLLLGEGDNVTIENVILNSGKELHVQPFDIKFTESKITKAV